MPLDLLPAKFVQPSRDQIAQDWRRDVSFRNPAADVGTGTQPYLDSLVASDTVLPLYTYAGRTAASTNWQNAFGSDLDAWLARYGTKRLDPTGSIGFVQISTSSGGTTLQTADQLTVNGIRYQVLIGGLYLNGAQVGIQGIDVGPSTDQRAGTVLKFSVPRQGCNPQCVVVAQQDGSGLSGGALQEDDSHAKLRLNYLASNPPASGNDAHYQSIVAVTPGVPVQQVFTYPGIMGNGSTGVCFTLRPSQSGASRIPNAGQIQLALAYLQAQMPITDGIYMCTIISTPSTMLFKVRWSLGAASWADASPFPLYQSPGNNWAVTNVVVPTPTTFNIMSATDATVPQVGQSIAFLDITNQTYRQKRILSATAASGGYTIVVDPTNGSSDLSYAPFVGQLVSPWSTSLNDLIDPVLAYFDSIGPGEQVASFFDAGLRQKRNPPNPQFWASQIANRMIGGPPNAAQAPDPNAAPTPTLLSTPSIGDVIIEEVNGTPGTSLPYSTPVGVPAVSSNMLTIASIVAFPE